MIDEVGRDKLVELVNHVVKSEAPERLALPFRRYKDARKWSDERLAAHLSEETGHTVSRQTANRLVNGWVSTATGEMVDFLRAVGSSLWFVGRDIRLAAMTKLLPTTWAARASLVDAPTSVAVDCSLLSQEVDQCSVAVEVDASYMRNPASWERWVNEETARLSAGNARCDAIVLVVSCADIARAEAELQREGCALGSLLFLSVSDLNRWLRSSQPEAQEPDSRYMQRQDSKTLGKAEIDEDRLATAMKKATEWISEELLPPQRILKTFLHLVETGKCRRAADYLRSFEGAMDGPYDPREDRLFFRLGILSTAIQHQIKVLSHRSLQGVLGVNLDELSPEEAARRLLGEQPHWVGSETVVISYDGLNFGASEWHLSPWKLIRGCEYPDVESFSL